MFKTKHVLFRTEAAPLDAERLLRERTVPGSAMPDHPLETLKDTVALDGKPFRGEVGGGAFSVTRRRRGRNVRLAVSGRLDPREDGGTTVKASIAAPKTLWAGLIGGLVGVGVVAAGALLGDLPGWVPLAMVGAEGLALGLMSGLYRRESSRAFSALRDAIPERVAPPVAPIVAVRAEVPAPPTRVTEG